MNQQASTSLISKSKQGAENCLQNIQRLESVAQQMERVKHRLQTLPEKLTHPTQVPVGIHRPGTPPLVLMNGHLKHTNEILVLLGDNWFVQRTAKQSIDILERRLRKTKQMIDDFQKEKESHEKWMEMVHSMKQDSENLVDLQENFDEAAEKRWREEHRVKVRAEKAKEREERSRNKCQEDSEIRRRIEHLELQEKQEEEEGRRGAAAFTGVVSERPAAANSSSAQQPLPSPASSAPQQPSTISKFAASRQQYR